MKVYEGFMNDYLEVYTKYLETENRVEILEAFEKALLATREKVSKLELVNYETVRIWYVDDYHKDINIRCDSGCAMMRDILKHVQ